jgi:hypothetical protein
MQKAEVFKVLSRRGFLAIRKARIRKSRVANLLRHERDVRFPPNKKRRPYRSLKFFSSLSPPLPCSPAPPLPRSPAPLLP